MENNQLKGVIESIKAYMKLEKEAGVGEYYFTKSPATL